MSIESHRLGREVSFVCAAFKKASGDLITNLKKRREKEFIHSLQEVYRLADEMDGFLTKLLDAREEKPDDAA